MIGSYLRRVSLGQSPVDAYGYATPCTRLLYRLIMLWPSRGLIMVSLLVHSFLTSHSIESHTSTCPALLSTS